MSFCCQYCGRSFVRKYGLSRHINENRCRSVNGKVVNININVAEHIEKLEKEVEQLKTQTTNQLVDVQSPEPVIGEQTTVNETTNIMTDEQIIQQVDNEAGYKISTEHPMEGVNYDSSRKKYDCVLDGKHNRSIDLHKLCELKRISILGKFGFAPTEISQACKKIIQYQNKHIISFWSKTVNDIVPLFDVAHILKLIDVSDRSERRIKQNIEDNNKYIFFEPNEYNGYTVRELIDEKTMYQIVLDSRSAFSKSFKSDVSDMLINLRKSGEIQFSGTVSHRRHKEPIAQSNVIETFSKEIIQMVNGGMKTTSDDNTAYIKNLIKIGENIRLSSYVNEHVLYFFVTNILSEKDHIICKIGYTSNISKRINSLEDEYMGIKFHLIGLKKIRNVSDEEIFHAMLKKRYSQLVYNEVTIKTTHKEELYVFDKCLWEEFNMLPEFNNGVKDLSLSDIMNEYKNGTIDKEIMKLMLSIMEKKCVAIN